ncbi:MAG: STAS-like domain-containing protein [Pseudomonadota bacterium]
MDIWHYGMTEMINNAIDHSDGATLLVNIVRTAQDTKAIIHDDGIGIFRKIMTELDLEDERHAVLELSKGKLTTDPTRHTGEGIFFTSRVFDSYAIMSGEVYFSHNFEDIEDFILQNERPMNGTTVFMDISNNTARTTKSVFDQYTTDEDYGFNKTVVPVKLAQYGNENLVSRSQAKRLLARVDRFRIVVFDFEDVETIGQAFADEIFRVFASNNADVEIYSTNMTKDVAQMVGRAKVREA